ncbi:sensor histidine kinase [Trujillonella humicola]|uniref:sensor histidine kinase n=1 Tax=Trujillonella humicola TaxID=3383699 RepID=UPI0039069254
MTAGSATGGRYGSILAVPTVTRWWESRTAPQRLDLYTRWSFYGWLGLTPALALLALAPVAAEAGPALVAAHVAGCAAVGGLGIALARAGLSAPRQAPAAPTALLGSLGLVALGTAGVGLAAAHGSSSPEAVVWAVGLPLAMVPAAAAPLWSSRVLAGAAAAAGAFVGLAAAAVGRPAAGAVAQGVTVALAVGGLAVAFRFSVWVLDVVVETERNRGVQLQLAVAEERLRFARDLHDVMGRNLSAIAVKSQLAGELVRRQRPEAADEVADISRIAEQSLREVREVVRGYRTADLTGELAGARSVLRAAGVSCTVTGEEHGGALPEDVQAALGWVVREAVTNVLRHSRAGTCTVTLAAGDRSATLTVVNDGAGPGEPRWGSGLTGLAERLAAASGRLTAGRDGGRFVLAATVPVEGVA